MNDSLTAPTSSGERASAAADGEPREIVAMRSAGYILLILAGLRICFFGLAANVVLSGVIDGVLGVQLLRLRYAWRYWAILRVGVGVAFGVFAVTFSSFASFGTMIGVLRGLTIVGYGSSVLLLLVRIPSARRILAGRITFALALAISVLTEIVLPLLQLE